MSSQSAFRRLLAKWSPDPEHPIKGASLPEHLESAAAVATGIVDETGAAALSTLGLSSDLWLVPLRRALQRAAWVHDLGKANTQFQLMIRSQNAHPQALRHEAISAWLLVSNSGVGDWLLNGIADVERYAVTAAVLGHHLKVPGMDAIAPRPGSGSVRLPVYGAHPDFTASTQAAGRRFGLPEPPRFPDMEIDLLAPDPQLRRAIADIAYWLDDQDHDTKLFVAMVKALLIGADVASSAVVRNDGSAEQWGREALGRTCTSEGLDRVVDQRLAGGLLRPFQQEMARSVGRVTFVRAGCGSGKTLGAYAWAARNAQGRKLFFCYPTTGTATEGFADYTLGIEGLEAELVHSRVEADLESILGSGTDESDALNDQEPALARTERARRWGLQTWDAQVTVATVDTVLGLIQNMRRGLFSSPAILSGAFVFDEIHQYDDQLYGSLLTFIKAVRGAPIVLMTASLQPHRVKQLDDAMADSEASMTVVLGPPDLEAIPRYVLSWTAAEPVVDVVRNAVDSGKRVLWVVNTVNRCRETARMISEQVSIPVLPYHSRYRYADRAERHRAVVDAFRGTSGAPVVAVTTQVCEVSLDLSADLMITELAPVPSLIQRLGRLNRRVTPNAPNTPCPALILQPAWHLPYTQAELALAQRWVDDLAGVPRSQADLARAFEALYADQPAPSAVDSAWLSGGAFSAPGQLREPGTTIPILRAEDMVEGMQSAEVTRNEIPMPLGPVAGEIMSWRRQGITYVSPHGRVDYEPRFGASWAS